MAFFFTLEFWMEFPSHLVAAETGSVGKRRQVRTLSAREQMNPRDQTREPLVASYIQCCRDHWIDQSEARLEKWVAGRRRDGRTGNGPVVTVVRSVVASDREARADPTTLAVRLDGCQCRYRPPAHRGPRQRNVAHTQPRPARLPANRVGLVTANKCEGHATNRPTTWLTGGFIKLMGKLFATWTPTAITSFSICQRKVNLSCAVQSPSNQSLCRCCVAAATAARQGSPTQCPAPIGLPRAARRNHLARPSTNLCVFRPASRRPHRRQSPSPSPSTTHPVNSPPSPPPPTAPSALAHRAHAPPPQLGLDAIAIVGGPGFGPGPGPGPGPQHSAHC